MSSSEVTWAEAMTRARLEAAWSKVQERGGGPGVDGVTVERFGLNALSRLDTLFAELHARAWKPKPARRVVLTDDPDRRIAVPTVRDRVVHRALADGMAARCDALLSPAAWAFRKGRGVLGALREVERHLKAGRRWIVRADVAHFFDEIDRDRLLDELPIDADLKRLVSAILGAGVSLGDSVQVASRGVPQGSPVSPLLANLYLRSVDVAMSAEDAGFLRYADDMMLLCRTATQAEAGLAALTEQIEQRGLTLKPRKTWRGHVAEGVDFLGARFDAGGRGPSSRAIAHLDRRAEALVDEPEALARFVASWTRWYGPVHRYATVGLAAIAGAALGARSVLAALSELAPARLARPEGGLPAALHARLVSVWLGGGEDALPCAIVEARAAARRGLTVIDQRRLIHALALPPQAITALRDPPRRLPALFAAHGQLRLAEAARSLLVDAVPDPARPDPGDDRLLEVLARIFGRQDRHLKERKDSRGHLRFQEVDAPLDADALQDHLKGGRRRAIYLCRSDGTVAVAVMRVRLQRDAALPRGPSSDGRAQSSAIRAQVHDFALHAARVAQARGWPCFIEAAPQGERRLWLLFERPVPLHHAHRALLTWREAMGDPPQCVRIDRTPARDRTAKGLGPWVVLPLGRDPRTQRDGHLLDEAGQPVADDIATLCSHPTVPAGRVRPVWSTGRVASVDAVQAPSLDGLPHARRVIAGCPMLRALSKKAAQVGLLDGTERATLYESLAFLPTEERLPALTVLLGPTGDDRARIARRLRRVPAWPIACASVRRRHPQLSCEVGCKCRFRSEKPGYATPVLHALRPTEVPIFLSKTPGRPKPAKDRPSAAKATASTRPARPGPRSENTRRAATAETVPPAATQAPPKGTRADQIAAALHKLANLRTQAESVRHGVARVEQSLVEVFRESGSDRIRVAQGWLVHRADAEPRFVIEL